MSNTYYLRLSCKDELLSLGDSNPVRDKMWVEMSTFSTSSLQDLRRSDANPGGNLGQPQFYPHLTPNGVFLFREFFYHKTLETHLRISIVLLIAGLYSLLNNPLSGQSPSSHSEVLNLMGSRFEIRAIATDDSIAKTAVIQAIDEIRRIESLISSWDPHSQTSEINRMAGVKPVKVSDELFQLISRSLKVSQLTGGAFDISYASADRIWKFDGSMTELPSEEEVARSVARIGYQKIILNPADTSVFLKEEGMKIGFGAIGKGYAATRAKEIMNQAGATGGLVNAGGDLTCWGESPNPQGWKIGIANPRNRDQLISWISVNDLAVVTSGDYEKFFFLEGQKYAHIIHPKTGYPVQGIQSVSIFCANAELADALATAIFVMGEKEGLALINQLNGIECLVINDKDEMIHSDNLSLNPYSEKKEGNSALHQLIIGKKKP